MHIRLFFHNFLSDFRRICAWIHRLPSSRGFGIQSPWAYSFVKEVITETLPYYDYYNIDSKHLDKASSKREKLYLRLRNRYPNCRFYSLKSLKADDIDFNSILQTICHEDVLVIEGIRDTKDLYEKWLFIRDLDAIGVTFDLYDIAICFPSDDKFKQHYKLNY